MHTCNNEIRYPVRRLSNPNEVIEVKVRCGGTGPEGQRLECDECEERIEKLKSRSPGWKRYFETPLSEWSGDSMEDW